ncbi:MAG: ribosomal-protein-alanine N-acetyltransferase [Salibacteraceae bacterium]
MLPNIETERLRFRLLSPDDFQAWLPLFAAKNVARFLGMDESLSQKELCQMWFDKVLNRYENDLGGLNVLVLKTTGELVGQCGLLIQDLEGQQRMEIGYSVLPKYWGRGYASEAAQKCKDKAFKGGFAEVLMSMVHVENIASEIVAKKNGMIWEKTVDQDTLNPMNIFSVKKP